MQTPLISTLFHVLHIVLLCGMLCAVLCVVSQEGDTQTDTDGRTIYDHSALAALGSSNPETQRMVELAKQAENRSKEVRGKKGRGGGGERRGNYSASQRM
jgi:hypothetical protein